MSSDQASSSTAPHVPKPLEIKQVNDSLYELYRPTGTPQLQILFFHGLRLDNYTDSHLSAWKSADGSCVWPQKWLKEDFPHAQVFTVSYGAAVERHSQVSMDMLAIGENLVSDLMQCDIGQIRSCPVILVGHSFGGLVIKEVISQAHHSLTKLSHGRERAKLQMFLDNVGGIFFYATPHHGSDHAKKLTNKISDPLLPFFNTFSAAGARLNQEFNDISARHNRWRTAGLGEGLPTRLGRNWGLDEEVIIVPEASARVPNFNLMEKDDHFSISKPKGKNSRNFYKLKEFVADINNDTKDVHQCQGLPRHGVDLQSRAVAVQKKLEAPLLLGIVGMGGIGKTTLAKTVFNLISRDFEYTCFVENVKGISPHEVQKSVLASFYRHGRQIDASKFSWRDLETKKTLLAMDDVDSELQLKNLPELKDFGDGSRVIITSRNENIFSCLESCHLYKVDFLESKQAEKMLCQYAELKEVPDSLAWRESKIKVVVKKCGGLPLTLEVLGCYLRGHVDDPKFWEQTITKLGQAESISGNDKDRLWESLRVSYDGLAQKEQEMFIEAAIYFFEEPLQRALAAWSGAYEGAETRCANLMSRSMMKVSSKTRDGIEVKTVWVHEQLRDLAARLAKKNYVVSRQIIENIGDVKEAIDFLNSDEVDENTKIVRVRNWLVTRREYLFQLDFLDKLRELKCLEVRCIIPAGRLRKFPRQLSLLNWEVPDVSSPPLFPHIGLKELSNLGVLELGGWEVPKEFPEALGNLTNLRILCLCRLRGLHHLPQNLGNLSQLKQLRLIGLDLLKLPESLGDLQILEELELDVLHQLKCLPESFCQLQSLKKLRIHSDSLEMLPDSLGQLASLQNLYIYCPGLTALPDTLGDLVRLVELTLRVRQVKALPKTLGCLVQLVRLSLSAQEVEALPSALGELVHLEDLHLDVPRVEGLQTIGQLSALPSLRIWRSGVASLPDTFGEFSSLQSLYLCKCPNLKKLPNSFGNLCALEELDILLDNLEELPENLGGLSHLREMRIESKCLTSLPTSLGQLSILRNLDIGCPSLTTLPESLGNLSSLETLDLRAAKLEGIPESSGHLHSLTDLTIHSTSLKNLPSSWCELSALQTLRITCPELAGLPDIFWNLSTLTELKLRVKCLGFIPESLGELRSLKTLSIESEILRNLPFSLKKLFALKKLRLHCNSLAILPTSVGQLPALEELLLHCDSLETLPDELGHLSSLQRLDIKVRSLVSMPESIGQLFALKKLQLHCNSLGTLPSSLGQLPALEELLLHCDSLETLPDELGYLSSLQTLDIKARSLVSMPESIGQLSSLNYLNVKVANIRQLPTSFGQLFQLVELGVECNHLMKLPDIFEDLSSLRKLNIQENSLDRFQEQRLALLGWRLISGERRSPPRGLWTSLLKCVPSSWICSESHAQLPALLKFERNSA